MKIFVRSALAVVLLLCAACGASGSTSVSISTSVSTTAGTLAPPVTATAAAASGFVACPANLTPTSGEPPASENGPAGACAAAAILFPASGMTCGPPEGETFAGSNYCPLYPVLASRLDSIRTSGSGATADPLCRCQNIYSSVAYSYAAPAVATPTTYVVRVRLGLGGAAAIALDVVVQEVASGSLVDDVRCAGGGATTSVLSTPVVACT